MNRRKRKLEFIRAKNYLNRGGSVFRAFKVSTEVLNMKKDEEKVSSAVLDSCNYEAKKLSEKYKLNLEPTQLLIGLDNDDFLKNVTSIRVRINKVR